MEVDETKKDSQQNNKKKKSVWSVIRIILIVIFVVIFLGAGYMLASSLIQTEKEQSAFDELARQVSEAEEEYRKYMETMTEEETTAEASDATSDEEPTTEAEPTILPKYAFLYKKNNDFYGWICIKGTHINYPVVYTPDDPQHYLKRAFEGVHSETGVPFIDARNPIDGHYIMIYGHHMREQEYMFGQLSRYAEKSYYEQHQIINFDTLYEEREYQVFAAFYSKIYAEAEEDGFRYYRYGNIENQGAFEEFVAGVKKAALYDTGILVEFGDEILALSTCEYHEENGRFVVVAKRIK